MMPRYLGEGMWYMPEQVFSMAASDLQSKCNFIVSLLGTHSRDATPRIHGILTLPC